MIELTKAIERYAKGITYRQVASWAERGYLRTEIRNGLGYGGQQRWIHLSECDVLEAMAALVKCGVVPGVAYRMARGDEGQLTALEKAVHACRLARQSLWRAGRAGG